MAPLTLRPGTTLAGYEIVALLGRGGMGTVYRARRGREEVALKTLSLPSATHLSEEALRLRREAALLEKLEHPSIVRLRSSGEAAGVFYLVMDLVEGESLEARLKRTGPLPTAEATRVVLSVARAIAFAHEQGIVHRDLKPANVLFTKDGRPLVLDFGLGRQLGESERLTVTGEVIGTPSYLSPEQAHGTKDALDERTDVYGLGALLYAALAGRPPFVGQSSLAILKKVSSEEAPAIKDLPPELDDLLRRALAKKREDRPGSARAFAAELEAALAAPRPLARAARALAAAAIFSAAALAALLAWDPAGRLTPRETPAPIASASPAPVTAPAPPSRPPADPNLEAYRAALAAPTIAALARLRREKKTPPPELTRSVGERWLEEAVREQALLRPKFQKLDLSTVQGAAPVVGLVGKVLDAFAAAREADRSIDASPPELDYTFGLVLCLNRGDQYLSLRQQLLKGWFEALRPLSGHPLLLYVKAQTNRDKNGPADERRALAHEARLVLENEAPKCSLAARVLAHHFVTDILGPAAPSEPGAATGDRAFFARYAAFEKEPIPPYFLNPFQLTERQ